MLGQRMRVGETEDPRPPLHKLRVWDLRKLAKQRGLDTRMGIDVDNMIKDELLEILGVEKYMPASRPLNSSGNAPLQKWADHGVRLEASHLGIENISGKTTDELIAEIERLRTAESEPLKAVQQPRHSVEELQKRPLKGMKIWELKKLASHLGIPWQRTWRGQDYISAIEEKRSGQDVSSGG